VSTNCKRCDKRVAYEDEHYNDSADAEGNVNWDAAGWTCKEVDWRKRFRSAEVELRMIKLAVAALHNLANFNNPEDALAIAMDKAGLLGFDVADLPDDEADVFAEDPLP